MMSESGGNHMAVESLTYAQIAERLGVTVNAARGLVKRLRLPRSLNNDRVVTTLIDFDEIKHRPQPTPPRRAGNYELGIIRERLAHAEAEFAAERERSRGYRLDYEHERERADQLVTTLNRISAELAGARQKDEERRMAEVEAAAVPALRDTVAALKAALDAEQARNRELRRARDAGGLLYRALRWMQKTG
jgi:hypothetical protein